ncbi:unnamed protein product [Pleuronectes platessa]|uniref:Cadherin Y-type LIR-motif domain-containing protein n=1 Tax=Pleuronectes platessa TaxID=8262 RepID=A0A9N7VDS7_PLEPL|nr:unnamed protein product [Pleuronectes platessa]
MWLNCTSSDEAITREAPPRDFPPDVIGSLDDDDDDDDDVHIVVFSRARIQRTITAAMLMSANVGVDLLLRDARWSLCLAAIVVVFVTLRRSKKEPLVISEEDIRENVVTYDDEGGGEEDTEAFDIIALRNPAAAEELKFRRDIRPESRKHCVPPRSRRSPSAELDEVDVHKFIKQKLVEADMDTSVPPYDSLQTYAFEGQGSPAGTVSPLDSAGTQSEQDYNYLDNWGPEFHKLAELYAEAESDVTT